jgi:imidazolonepropionase-like amidohydrolase
VHVHLGATGGISTSAEDYQNIDGNINRELAAYLYSGVTAVKSVGDALDSVLQHRAAMASGERLGAELFAVGPMFTTAGGHGTEYSNYAPESVRATMEEQFVRLPKSPDEARMQVAELKTRGVDGIKAILDAGAGSTRYNRMEPSILRALAEAARSAHLPIVTHTGNAQDVADALDAHVDGIEHGSMRDTVPVELFARMKQMGVTYDPTLAVMEAIRAYGDGKAEPLDRSLVQQVGPRGLLERSRQRLVSTEADPMRAGYGGYPFRPDLAGQNLLAAYRAGVMLVAGTDSGNPLMIHGPGIHRELQLWVALGVPPAVALQAATYNNAQLLRAANRIGLIRKGYEASLLLVDGNPLQDISATERISMVLLKGERVARQDLFNQK